MAKNRVTGLNGSGIDVLNTIRANIIANGDLSYGDRIPVATQENLKDIGSALLTYQPAMNEFLNELINQIGLTVVKQKSFKNKLAFLKRGFLEYGDSIQEIYTDLIKAHTYTPEPPENNAGDVFEQFKPEVYEAFHKVNREDTYTITINEAMLKRAFRGYANFDSFVASIFNAMYNSDEEDEYLIFKQLLGDTAKNSYKVNVVKPVKGNKQSATDFSIDMRDISMKLEYMSRKYNQMGVANHTSREEQVLFLRSDVIPVIDVLELANAFNMNMAQPLANRIISVDDFGTGNDDIIAMVADSDVSMIYDTRYETASIYNPRHLYWNYFLHHHQIISSSPFSNVIALTTEVVADTINSISINPEKAEVMKGTTQQFTATLDYVGSPDLGVTYSVEPLSSEEKDSLKDTKISAKGKLVVGLNETATGCNVKVTSKADTSKTATTSVTFTDYIVG